LISIFRIMWWKVEKNGPLWGSAGDKCFVASVPLIWMKKAV
jgi:hypothetical protein